MVDDYSFEKKKKKWINKWKEEEIFNVEVTEKEPYFVNVAYPYPSGSMHVGHGRTYTLPDIIARYKRMDGYNVLFPMAWHVTGTPVIGISRRIRERDEGTLDIYKNLYGVPDEKIEDFEDPLEIVDYFSQEYKNVMTRLGYSIDWKREFKTVDEEYSSFIEWQYRKLKGKNLIKKGTHPVKYCPNDENALGDHDLLEGEEAQIDDFYLIKFSLEGNDVVLPCATLRPETVFGVTNIWVKPDGDYVEVEADEENWVVSKQAVKKLKEQSWSIKEKKEIKGRELIGKEAVSPFSEKIPILEADFVNLNVATGLVMSVPAHAPYDFIALKDIDSGIDSKKIIETPKYGKIPAKEVIEEYGINNQSDDSLEDATEELYNKEFNEGEMVDEIKEYGGLSVREARESIGGDLLEEGLAEKMYEFNQQPVVCRCGTHAVVKILKDQWFLDYSNQDWKEKTKAALDKTDLIPSDIKKDFDHSIDWLEEWACTRRVGLGTNLPWDKEWIVEPLSDSTIYMSYYTISDKIKGKNDSIKDVLFDYLFLDEEEVGEVVEKTGLEESELKEMKKSFEYWYPYDYRFSAKDLIPNHLTFQLFHHTALFDEENWPRGISVLGMGLLEGKKMSSSKGHVVLLEDAIKKYGSDTVRFFLAENAEPWQDFDWREEGVKATQNKLIKKKKNIEKYLSFEEFEGTEDELKTIDKWLLSKFNKKIKKTRHSLEKHQTRKALQNAFYLIKKDLKWYKKRVELDREATKWCLKKIANQWVRLLSPFIPFITEEIWSKNHDSFISTTPYPEPNESLINDKIEFKETIIREITEDINEIIEVTKKSPEKIHLYVPKKWKKDLLSLITEETEIERGKLMKKIMEQEKYRKRGEKVNEVLGDLIEINRTHGEKLNYLNEIELKDLLEKNNNYFEEKFGAKITIQNEENPSHDPEKKSKDALPLKPAIYIE